jgi:autotransporter-associated beta strand protein
MKTTSRFLAACAALIAFTAAAAHAQSWDGGGVDNNWGTADNWNPNAVPTTGGTLSFTGSARMTNINNLVDFTAGSAGNALVFNNINPYHLSGNALKLNGNISFGAAALTSSVTHEIALDLALQNNYTISTSTTGFGNLKISGAITGNFTVNKSNVGDLELTGTSSFGNLTVTAGRVLINTIANGGSNSALGAGSQVQIGASTTNGTLVYTGATASTNKQIQIGQALATATITGAGSVLNEGAGELTFTNAAFNRSVTQNTTISRSLTIGGTGNVTIQGQIANNSANATINIEKSGNGRLTLSGNNTYTGTTMVNAGTLLIDGSTHASSSVTVASGAVLSGNGTIGGFTMVNGNLNPGNSPGVLTFSSGLTLNGTTTMEITAAGTPGTHFDQVVVSSGTTTFGGALAFAFGSSALLNNDNIALFNLSGTSLGNFSGLTSTGFYNGTWSVGEANDTWTLNQNGQILTFSEVTGNLNVVPEPATWALLAASLTTVMALRRRRSQ